MHQAVSSIPIQNSGIHRKPRITEAMKKARMNL